MANGLPLRLHGATTDIIKGQWNVLRAEVYAEEYMYIWPICIDGI
jgi:hypothetical protein